MTLIVDSELFTPRLRGGVNLILLMRFSNFYTLPEGRCSNRLSLEILWYATRGVNLKLSIQILIYLHPA